MFVLHIFYLFAIILLLALFLGAKKSIFCIGDSKMAAKTGIFYAEILAWAGADVILVSSYFLNMKKLK